MRINTDQVRIDCVEQMKNLLVAFATGGSAENADYVALRKRLLDDPLIGSRLPGFLRNCRTLPEFWGFIKAQFGTYAERRSFIWDAFNPIANELEAKSNFPSDAVCAAVIGRVDRAHVYDQWQKAVGRRETDPAGAITAARSLLESVCKSILHEAGVSFDEGWDLPRLYKETSELLHLAPSQHTEPVFKKVLGGCHAVVVGIGEIRNSSSDAHGASPLRTKPTPRHAQLVVNLAFSAATFLIETWEDRSARKAATVSPICN